MEAELKDDTQTNLETYRKQVVEAINNDIVMRYGYQAGVIEHSLPGDKGGEAGDRGAGQPRRVRPHHPRAGHPAQITPRAMKLSTKYFSFRNRLGW